MHSFVHNEESQIKENVVAGIVGAFLFSLAGAVVYFLLYLVGYVASISGLVGAVCAVKGYALFSKKESKKGIVISAIIAVLVMVLAWYFCLAYDIYDAYKLAFEAGEIDFSLTLVESIRYAPIFLEDPEIASASYGNLALGLLFCLLGSGSYVFNKIKSGKNSKKGQQEAIDPTAQQTEIEKDEWSEGR